MQALINLLFIHGWATDSFVWEGQIAELSKYFSCQALDLPGHGSNKTWNGTTLRPAINHVLDYARNLDPKNSTVGIGWSLGGQVLLDTAALMPELFKGLVLVGTTTSFIKRDHCAYGQRPGVVRRMKKDLQQSFIPSLNRFYQLNFTDTELKTEEARRFVAHYASVSANFHKESVIAGLDALVDANLETQLQNIDMPTLIIHGTGDNIISFEAGKALANSIPGARLELIDGSGHAPFLTKRKLCNTILRDFLKQI